MEPFLTVLALLVVAGVVIYMFWARARRMKEAQGQSDSAFGSGLSTSKDLFADETKTAPVESFHVAGHEARVTFAVPLGDEEDEVLNDLLVAQAVEVVRSKRRTLPIDGVTEIVALAGEPAREVGRAELPAPGELPPPVPESGFSLQHLAHDPFAKPFEEETDHSVSYDTPVRAPDDDLPPIRDELRLPKGLERGLRTAGTDPDSFTGPDFIIALLRMFGYSLTEHASEGSYMAMKDGVTTYILTDAYSKGQYPELDEGVVRRFLAEFGSSGANRGMLITDKYSPYMIYEIESHQPKVRFITRERLQRFVDSMSIG